MTNMRSIVWTTVGILLLAAANFMLSKSAPHETALVPRTSLVTIPDSEITLVEDRKSTRLNSSHS